MTSLRFTLMFFRVVPPVTRPIRGCLWLTAVVGLAALAAFDAARGEAVLTPLLVLQIFAASSGFSSAARRGHYDLLYCRGIRRGQVAAAHWLASAAPGVAAWLAFGLAEPWVSSRPAVAFAPGSLVALGLASSLPWAVTTRLPRFGAAIGWLMALVTTIAVAPSGQAALLATLRDPSAGLPGTFALLTYPMGAIGMAGSGFAPLTLGPALSVAAVATVAAVGWHARAEATLEAGS